MILISALLLLQSTSRAAEAQPVTISVFREGARQARVELRPAADGSSVELLFGEPTSGEGTKARFDGSVLEALREKWGARPFDVSGWSSELDCSRRTEWRVTAAGQTRRVCADVARVAMLNRVLGAVQSALKSVPR